MEKLTSAWQAREDYHPVTALKGRYVSQKDRDCLPSAREQGKSVLRRAQTGRPADTGPARIEIQQRCKGAKQGATAAYSCATLTLDR